MKKHFHITWFDKIEDMYSKGETVVALSEVEAIILWGERHPTAIFLSCISSEVLELKRCVSSTAKNNSGL